MTEHATPDEPDPTVVDDLEVPADEGEHVKGGRPPLEEATTPKPGGPVPLPYPNRSGR
jgi:hypothetical protein